MVRTLPSLSHKCRVIHPIKLKIGDRKVPGYFSGESMGGRGNNDKEKEDKIIKKILNVSTIEKE